MGAKLIEAVELVKDGTGLVVVVGVPATFVVQTASKRLEGFWAFHGEVDSATGTLTITYKMKLNKNNGAGDNGSFVAPTTDSGSVVAVTPAGTLEFGDAFNPVLSQEYQIILTATNANVTVNWLQIGFQ